MIHDRWGIIGIFNNTPEFYIEVKCTIYISIYGWTSRMESKETYCTIYISTKKYKTGKRFGGNYIYKINQESELYKQIKNFYDLNRKTVE